MDSASLSFPTMPWVMHPQNDSTTLGSEDSSVVVSSGIMGDVDYSEHAGNVCQNQAAHRCIGQSWEVHLSGA